MTSAECLRERFHYDPGTGIFTSRVTCGIHGRWKAGRICGSLNTIGYLTIWFEGRNQLVHRLAWLYVHGRWPAQHIDHINGDKTDNRIANLREATVSQNLCNQKKRTDNTSGLKGACFDRGRNKWLASIRKNGKQIHLGRFDTAEEAHAAYCAAAVEIHGEFANPGSGLT